MDKHIVWSDMNLDFEDWRDDLEQCYPDCTEDELYDIMYQTNADYLDDERANLNVNIDRTIIAIGDLGLWYGRRSGYKVIGNNLSECLYTNDDYAEWYVDSDGEFKCKEVNHDGSNNIVYRAFKKNVGEEKREELLEKIYRGEDFSKELKNRTISIGRFVNEVYGW